MDKHGVNDMLNRAHIHLSHSTYKVYVDNADVFPIKIMNMDPNRPKFVLWVGQATDPADRRGVILACVQGEDYDLNELAAWIWRYDNRFRNFTKRL